MGINELRVDWQRQIEAYDRQIALLEEANVSGGLNDVLNDPYRKWTSLLHTWRDQLRTLLAIYPAE